LKSHSFLRNLNRYVVASVISNLVAFSLYCAFVSFPIVFTPITAFASATLLALPLSFSLNRFWVFSSKNNILAEFSKFCLGYLSAMFLGMLLLTSILKWTQNPYTAQFFSMAILGSSAFLVHSLWTFKSIKSSKLPL